MFKRISVIEKLKNADALEWLESRVDPDALDPIGRSIFRDCFDQLYRLVVFQGLGDAPVSQELAEDVEVLGNCQYYDD